MGTWGEALLSRKQSNLYCKQNSSLGPLENELASLFIKLVAALGTAVATPSNVYVVSFLICNIRGETRGVFRIMPSAGATKKNK